VVGNRIISFCFLSLRFAVGVRRLGRGTSVDTFMNGMMQLQQSVTSFFCKWDAAVARNLLHVYSIRSIYKRAYTFYEARTEYERMKTIFDPLLTISKNVFSKLYTISTSRHCEN